MATYNPQDIKFEMIDENNEVQAWTLGDWIAESEVVTDMAKAAIQEVDSLKETIKGLAKLVDEQQSLLVVSANAISVLNERLEAQSADIKEIRSRLVLVSNIEGRLDQLEESYSANQADYQDRLAKLEGKVRVLNQKTRDF